MNTITIILKNAGAPLNEAIAARCPKGYRFLKQVPKGYGTQMTTIHEITYIQND